MALQDHAEPSTNEMGTVSRSGSWLTPSDSRTVLRRELILMRNKNGATSPILTDDRHSLGDNNGEAKNG